LDFPTQSIVDGQVWPYPPAILTIDSILFLSGTALEIAEIGILQSVLIQTSVRVDRGKPTGQQIIEL
jgi:hypothetical protein